MPEETSKPYLPQNIYEFLKKVQLIVLPAFGSAYFALAGIWSLPAADKVTGTVVVVATFLGVLLSISSGRYMADNSGAIIVSEQPDGTMKQTWDLKKTPEEMAEMTNIHMKVIKDPNQGYLANLPSQDDSV